MARVHAAEFTLRDAEGPSAGDTGGRLASAGAHAGTEALSFTAADSVSGVYRALVEIDGRVVRTEQVADPTGHCADAGVDPSTAYEFLYPEPCPKAVQHDLALDTRTLTDGTHSLRVLVEDAAGNRTTVWSSSEFTVRNTAGAGAPAGPPAAAAAGTAKPSSPAGPAAPSTPGAGPCAASAGGLSARFRRNGARTLTLTHGQAFAVDGSGPRNAAIDVFHVRGARTTALGSLRSSADGRFTGRLNSRRGNGTLHLCGPGVAARLTLRVRAKVAFAVRIFRGGLVRYSGRVATGQIPRGGKIVVVQGKAGPSWQTFALRRTDRQGRFKGRYRLRVVWPGAKLRFRVRVPGEAGYPFLGVVGRPLTRTVR